MMEYKLEKAQNSKAMIIVTCPVCGKPGRLVSAGNKKWYGRKYKVLHDGVRGCNISWFHPAWEEVDEIYRKVRQR